MRLGRLSLEWPVVMGILNVTPDSFSDGGRFQTRDAALRHAEQMVAAGAAIIDVGGESTRPGAATVAAAEELDRVLPVVEALRASTGVAVSVDTSKPEVMRAAVAAGADLINDVRALREEGALQAVAETGVAVCLMHMLGEPGTMQVAPEYEDVTAEVTQFLATRLSQCVNAGIRRDRILLDPGFGFGKTHAHNMRLLADLGQLTRLGQPLLVGLSRKASLGLLTGKPADERAAASAAAAVIAVLQGAAIVRVHDVPETIDALRVVSAFIDTQSI